MLDQFEKEHSISGYMVFTMDVGFSSPLSDLSNAIKCTEDILMEYYGVNDRDTVEIRLRKYLVHKGDEFMKISIYPSRRKNVDLRLNYRKGEAICGL